MKTEIQFLDQVIGDLQARRAELVAAANPEPVVVTPEPEPQPQPEPEPVVVTPAPAPVRVPMLMPGVNLASAEFAADKLPGVHGRDYLYPDDWEFGGWAKKGFKVIRLPVLMERVQPQAMGEFSSADIQQVDRCVKTAASVGLSIIIDAHNYGQRAGKKLDVEDAPNFWWRMGTRYRDAANVIFGIMNEPSAFGPTDWQYVLRKCVGAIRVTGAKQLILAPGAGWNGAHDFVANGNAAAFEGFTDSGNNVAIEVHQYLDGDSSGTHLQEYISGKGATVLKPVTEWARSKGFKLFLAEHGFAMPAGETEARAMLQYMTDNSDVWLGHTAWAAGQWWGDYAFTLEPTSQGDRPQVAVLQSYMG